MMKSTYGTGCFALLNTGRQSVISRNRLLTTIAYQLERQAHLCAGRLDLRRRRRRAMAARRAAGSSAMPAPPAKLAAAADPDQEVYLVPAFVGLGRAVVGCRGARRDLRADPQHRPGRARPRRARSGVLPDPRSARGDARRLAGRHAADTVLRVDGGMVASDWTMQFLADILDAPVDRPTILETTALGAAWLAGTRCRPLPGSGRIRQELAARPPLHAADGRGHAGAQIRRLARCRGEDAVTGRVRGGCARLFGGAVASLFSGKALVVQLATRRPLSARLRYFVVIAGGPIRTVGAPMPGVSALVSSIGWHAGTPLLAHKQIKYNTVRRHALLHLYSEKASQGRIGLNDSKRRLSLSSGTALVGRRRTLRLHHAQPVYGQCA